ncbi:methyltransferase domain-containing protein [Dactylosporangium sp. CA-233914]|uniref:methyltransferase domain-containing protein n=1 Tax=Dactylosporangium sp. CA-233914 TaxID=3239934 RepID=UPI003D900F05
MSTTTAGHDTSQYSFSNAAHEGDEQLGLLAAILDENSTGVLGRTGITAGWRCLDIGSGAGTLTHWMAGRVGPGGHVTSLDLDPRHVPAAANVTVRQGDVRTAELPADHYDLIHARLLLLHLSDRDAVIRRLVAALRPGGLLVTSDWDTTRRDVVLHAPGEAAAAFEAFQDALLGILEDNGADLGWARRAALSLRAAGLADVRTEVHNRLWPGGTAANLLHASNSHQLRDALLARGVSAQQLDLVRTAMRDPQTLVYCYPTYTSIGRRPGG